MNLQIVFSVLLRLIRLPTKTCEAASLVFPQTAGCNRYAFYPVVLKRYVPVDSLQVSNESPGLAGAVTDRHIGIGLDGRIRYRTIRKDPVTTVV